MNKVSKSSVHYRDHSSSAKKCGTCGMFNAATKKCDLVQGIINPVKVCDRWIRKTN